MGFMSDMQVACLQVTCDVHATFATCKLVSRKAEGHACDLLEYRSQLQHHAVLLSSSEGTTYVPVEMLLIHW